MKHINWKVLLVSLLTLIFAFPALAEVPTSPQQQELTADDELSPDEIRFEDLQYGTALPPEDFKIQGTKVTYEDPRNLFHLPAYGYSLIIHVDKSKQGTSQTAQTLRVFSMESTVGPQLLFKWKVSTGAEAKAINKMGEETSRKTNAGFYHVQNLFPHETYKSRAWEVSLPWAVAYDMNGGFYIHATVPSHYVDLGKRASGGCTRLTYDNARTLLTLVQKNGQGPVLNLDRVTGQPLMDKRTGMPVTHVGYKTLVIIEDVSESNKKTVEQKQAEESARPQPELTDPSKQNI